MRSRSAPSLLLVHRGFTLVELVIVIILLGILAVTALPNLSSTSTFAEAGFRDEVVAALRYAQKSAVSHRRLVCADLTATTVTLRIAASNDGTPLADCGAAVLPAPNGAAAFASSSSATLGLTAGAVPATLFFQPDGRITDTDGVVWAAGITVTEMPNIVIEGATGYVK